MKNVSKLIFLMSILLVSSLISAEEFGYNYLEGDLNIVSAINYSTVNVNNSVYWNGYPFSHLADTYVPYTGANKDVNLGNNNLTVNGGTTLTGGISIGNGVNEKQPLIKVYNGAVDNPYLEYDNDFMGSGFAGASWISTNKDSAFASRSETSTAYMVSWSENLSSEVGIFLMNTLDRTQGSGWLMTKRADIDNALVFEFQNYSDDSSFEALTFSQFGDAIFYNNVTASYFIGDGSQLTGIDGSFFKLDQTTPQTVTTGTGTSFSYDEYDIYGGGAGIFPRLKFGNSNLLGVSSKFGLIDKGLLVADEDDYPQLYFVGSNVLTTAGVGAISYDAQAGNMLFHPNVFSELTHYVNLSSLDIGGSMFPIFQGINSDGTSGLGVDTNLVLYLATGNPILTFFNGDTMKATQLTVDENGMLLLGGYTGYKQTKDATTGYKILYKAGGNLVTGNSSTGDRTTLLFSDGASTGIGAGRNIGAVSGVLTEQGTNWKGGLALDVFTYRTNGTDEQTAYPNTAIMIAHNKYVTIGSNQTSNYPLTVVGNSSDISIWAEANISATGYITRTSVYEEVDGKSIWDFIKSSSYYLNVDGSINHSKFYGFTENKILIYPNTKLENLESCVEVCDNEITRESCVPSCETKKTLVIDYDKPIQKIEAGVNLGKEIDILREAVYELKQENNILTIKNTQINQTITNLQNENNIIKAELCRKDNSYSWCLGVIKE